MVKYWSTATCRRHGGDPKNVLTTAQKNSLAKKLARNGIAHVKRQPIPENGEDMAWSTLSQGLLQGMFLETVDYEQMTKKVVTAVHALGYQAKRGWGGGVEIKPRPKKKKR